MSKGISAVVATILLLVITIAMSGLAYMYISGIFTRATSTVSVIDSFCVDGTIKFFLVNEGSTTIKSDSLRLITVDADCSGSFTLQDLPPGQNVEINITGCSSGRQHTFRLITPAGGIPLSQYCA